MKHLRVSVYTLQQIKDKKYYEKYRNADKEIILVGAALEQQTRNIGEWLTESKLNRCSNIG